MKETSYPHRKRSIRQAHQLGRVWESWWLPLSQNATEREDESMTRRRAEREQDIEDEVERRIKERGRGRTP